MGFELQGSRVLVTGASSGIGAGLAEAFARAGASVGMCARRADRLGRGGGTLPCARRRDLPVDHRPRGTGAGRRARARRPRRDGWRRHPREQRGYPEASSRHRHRRRDRRSGHADQLPRAGAAHARAAPADARARRGADHQRLVGRRHAVVTGRDRVRGIEVGAGGVLRVHGRRPLGTPA